MGREEGREQSRQARGRLPAGLRGVLRPFLRVVDADDEMGETREGVLGLTRDWQLLLVVFVEREETFRIISARRATRMERRLYEDQ